MKKSEVYSWRISRDLRMALEQAARERRESLSALLERIARVWLGSRGNAGDAGDQRRRHEAAARCVGAIAGGVPGRSRSARGAIRTRIRTRWADRRRPR